MRALLLAGVAGLAFTLLPAAPVRAQLAVVCPLCASELSQYAGWAKQAGDMLRELQQLQQQYQLLTRTYEAIAHATDVGGLSSALGGVTRTYLPEAAGIVAMVGQGSRMFGRAGSFMAADQLYIPQALSATRQGERWLAEMDRREKATANAKGIADAGLIDMEARTLELAAAEARIAASQDGTEVGAVAALIATNRSNIETHRAAIDSVRLALHAEDRVERQRGEQMEALGAAEWADRTRGALDAMVGLQ